MYSLLSGLWTWAFSKRTIRVLLLGIDGAGKTTLLEQLKRITKQPALPLHKIKPTVGLNSDCYTVARIETEHAQYVLWDLGGQEGIRSLWRNYFPDAYAIVYVIDASDRDRLLETKKVYEWVRSVEGLKHLPMRVLLNKHDKERCVALGFVRELLELEPEVQVVYGSGITQ